MVRTFLNEADDKALIKITPAWMEEKFNEMNKLLFGGRLGGCRFSLFTTGKGNEGRVRGWFKIHPEPTVFKKCNRDGVQFWYRLGDESFQVSEEDFAYYLNPEILLNGNYIWTEKAALSTLVHEMCHYYQHINGFYPAQTERHYTKRGIYWTASKYIHHGADFQRIAAMVSAKSNEFFTVGTIMSAEAVEQTDWTDEFREKKKARAIKGIDVFLMKLAAPTRGSKGNWYEYAYAVKTNGADAYINYLKTNADTFSRAFHCTTTDENVLKHSTVRGTGYYYSKANSIETIMPDVRFDTTEEIDLTNKPTVENPYYVFAMEYKYPYSEMKGKQFNIYPYGYIISSSNDFEAVSNLISINRDIRDKFKRVTYYETRDPKVLSMKLTPLKWLSDGRWWIVKSINNIPYELGPERVLYDDSASLSESDLRYMVSETLQRLKRRTITKK